MDPNEVNIPDDLDDINWDEFTDEELGFSVWREKVVPVLWLFGCFILLGAEVGVWLRG